MAETVECSARLRARFLDSALKEAFPNPQASHKSDIDGCAASCWHSPEVRDHCVTSPMFFIIEHRRYARRRRLLASQSFLYELLFVAILTGAIDQAADVCLRYRRHQRLAKCMKVLLAPGCNEQPFVRNGLLSARHRKRHDDIASSAHRRPDLLRLGHGDARRRRSDCSPCASSGRSAPVHVAPPATRSWECMGAKCRRGRRPLIRGSTTCEYSRRHAIR